MIQHKEIKRNAVKCPEISGLRHPKGRWEVRYRTGQKHMCVRERKKIWLEVTL